MRSAQLVPRTTSSNESRWCGTTEDERLRRRRSVCAKRETMATMAWQHCALSQHCSPRAVVVLGRLILLVFCGSRRQFVRQPSVAFKRASCVPLPVRAALRWQHVANNAWQHGVQQLCTAEGDARRSLDATTHLRQLPLN